MASSSRCSPPPACQAAGRKPYRCLPGPGRGACVRACLGSWCEAPRKQQAGSLGGPQVKAADLPEPHAGIVLGYLHPPNPAPHPLLRGPLLPPRTPF